MKGSPAAGFLPAERRAVASLAAIHATRMLGLFMLLPVLALYAGGLPGATPALAGLAVGAYGLAQAALQLPFGAWSDRVGRRPLIAGGLVLYIAGSALGGLAAGIHGVIAARLLQGAGAISGPVTALLADLTRTPMRTRAMAVIGISIGACFVISLVGAPLLAGVIGVPGIFWTMALLGAMALLLLYTIVPVPPALAVPARRVRWSEALTRGLAPQYGAVFALNFSLTATFVGIPHALEGVHGIATPGHWRTYLPVFLASLAGTVPLILLAERLSRPERLIGLAAAALAVSQLLLAGGYAGYPLLAGALTLYFAAFNFLEARLPARLTELAPAEIRGAALGLFATGQFLGAFAGGLAGGVLFGSTLGLQGVFTGAAVVTGAWAAWSLAGMGGKR